VVILAGSYLGCHVLYPQSCVEVKVGDSMYGLDRCLLWMKAGVLCS
jgi:hypothetical protein